MRVIGGEFRSRRLKTLPGLSLRPTPDRLREALFNVLAPRIEGRLFLDAYAGCGAAGIEALSRGARQAIFIEAHRPAVGVIYENLRSLGLESRATVIWGKATAFLARFRPDIVFLDPPYTAEGEYQAALDTLGRTPPPLAVVQHASRFELKESYGRLRRTRVLKQGDNSLSFFEPERPAESSSRSRGETGRQ